MTQSTATLTEQTVASRIAEFLSSVGEYPGRCAGRGIVTCAGGIRYHTCAWVLIRMLRKLGCQLPIEVWYLGEKERSRQWERLVEPLGVRCVDAHERLALHPHRRLSGWESKPYAILHSRFEEVLFLDADVVPVRDPSFLFEQREYQQKGAIFWPDPTNFRTPPASKRWRIFDVPYRDELDQESGQLLVNKRRCWRALSLCNWFNEHSDFFYKYVYGDKDTFRFAWHRAGQAFAMPQRAAGQQVPRTLVQYDLDGQPLFQHRHGAKWGLRHNTRCPGFALEDQCLEMVNELKRRWDPVAELAGDLCDADFRKMDEFRGRRFRRFRRGRRGGRVTLRGERQIHSYPGRSEDYWWFGDERLVVATDAGRQVHRLREQHDGVWQSAAGSDGVSVMRLVPAS